MQLSCQLLRQNTQLVTLWRSLREKGEGCMCKDGAFPPTRPNPNPRRTMGFQVENEHACEAMWRNLMTGRRKARSHAVRGKGRWVDGSPPRPSRCAALFLQRRRPGTTDRRGSSLRERLLQWARGHHLPCTSHGARCAPFV